MIMISTVFFPVTVTLLKAEFRFDFAFNLPIKIVKEFSELKVKLRYRCMHWCTASK